MQLQEIDKSTYRKRYKQVLLMVIAALSTISIGFSALLIALIGNPQGGNFWLNVAGVAVAAVAVIFALKRYSCRPFMAKLRYVWRLKQQLNDIYRKLNKIKTAADQNDRDALVILKFYYAASEQLYTLDDNTITMDDLRVQQHALDNQVDELGLEISPDEYDQELLAAY